MPYHSINIEKLPKRSKKIKFQTLHSKLDGALELILKYLFLKSPTLLKAVTVMNQTLKGTAAHICKHNKQFLKHKSIFAKHNTKLSKHNTKLSKHNTKLSKHNTKLSKHNTKLSKHNTKFSKHNTKLSKHNTKLSKQHKVVETTQNIGGPLG